MKTQYDNPVQYSFIIGENEISLNDLLNKELHLNWTGQVYCSCGKVLSKFYRQNFCYQCYWNAPQASPSIFKPELCTADLDIEERDLEWEKNFQISPHYVYLANSTGLKVGITRKTQKLTRWMDQGATQGIVLAEVPNRRLSGLIEVELKKSISDRTNWRKMLSGVPEFLNMLSEKEKCLSLIPPELKEFITADNEVTKIKYPISIYPQKINSLSFQKHDSISGKLIGIKGQYLILENDKVFNVRSHQGYMVDFLF